MSDSAEKIRARRWNEISHSFRGWPADSWDSSVGVSSYGCGSTLFACPAKPFEWQNWNFYASNKLDKQTLMQKGLREQTELWANGSPRAFVTWRHIDMPRVPWCHMQLEAHTVSDQPLCCSWCLLNGSRWLYGLFYGNLATWRGFICNPWLRLANRRVVWLS